MSEAKKLTAYYYALDDRTAQMELLADNLDKIPLLPDALLFEVVDRYNCYNINYQTEDIQKIFKVALDELCNRKKAVAIQKRGYCYYGGTKIYPTDWIKARDSFIKHYSMTGDPNSANTLGYIFYYGRTNNGIPEYKKAFKYFSIGNLGGAVESKYKLADMFYHGYYVKKNVGLAYDIYRQMYSSLLISFLDKKYWCEFADIALRIGRYFYEGQYPVLEEAYKYYLQADLAIRKRMAYNKYYGDTSVFRNIQTSLNEVRDKYFRENPKSLKYYLCDFEWIEKVLVSGRICKATYKMLKTGELQLTFTLLRDLNTYGVDSLRFLITIPSADYCEVKEKLELKTEGFENIFIAPDRFYLDETDEKRSFIFTSISYYDFGDFEEPIEFYFYNKRVASISCRNIYFTAPKKKKNNTKYHFVRVAFDSGYRTYDYLCDDLTVKVGDTVVVNTDRGEVNVRVVEVLDMLESELLLPFERYKKIERKI